MTASLLPAVAETVALANAALDRGVTVYVCTYARAVKLTPAARERFRAVGRELLWADGRGARLASGKGSTYLPAETFTIREDA